MTDTMVRREPIQAAPRTQPSSVATAVLFTATSFVGAGLFVVQPMDCPAGPAAVRRFGDCLEHEQPFFQVLLFLG